ncbi:MAG: YfhO family protein [Candidatus Eremiobacteraeota bacterium]|nr:YfhO family protein [Candidatus Eremiobacteraeota bacterium]
MSETAWPEGYWRDARWIAGCLALILFAAFAPFLVGPYSLLSSAGDAPSLYLTGAVPTPLPNRPLKVLDPGAEAWQSQARLQVEHDALLIDHRVPWWDPYDGYGAPFAAAAQPQPFFPLTALASLRPSPRTWDWYVVARLYLAGFFAALFVRFYGGRFAALGAALAASFTGYYLLYYGMPHLSVETLLPAGLWATEYVVRRPGFGSVAALGTVVGLIHLGGMPESAALAFAALALYVVVRVWTSERTAIPFARLGTFAGANVLGALVGAAALVPFVRYLPDAIDTHRSGQPPGLGYDGIPFVQAVFHKLVPLAYGPPLNALTDPAGNGFSGVRGWFGATVAAAALIAVFDALRRDGVRRASRGPAIALAVVFACALGKSIGAPFINWIGALPVLRLVLFQKYGDAEIGICAALLCGLGIAVLERREISTRWIGLAAGASAAFVLFAGYIGVLSVIPPTGRVNLLYTGVAFAAVLLAALTVLLAAPNRFRYAPAIAAAIVGLEVIGNYYVPMYGRIAAIPATNRNPYAGAPYIDAIRSTNRQGLRVVAEGGPLWPNWAGAMRLDDPEALNGMYPTRYMVFLNAFLQRADPTSRDLFDRFDGSGGPSFTTPAGLRWMTLSSIGYVVMPAGRAIDDPHLRLVHDGDALVYAYDAPLPRASIFHRSRRVSADGALAALRDPRTDVTRTLFVEGAGDASLPNDLAGDDAGESAHIDHRDVSGATITAELHRPGYVMLNDTMLGGWTATVDGAPAPIVEADYLFRAVRLDAGRHRIEFRYAPRAATVGLALSLFGVAVVVVLVALARRRRTVQIATS